MRTYVVYFICSIFSTVILNVIESTKPSPRLSPSSRSRNCANESKSRNISDHSGNSTHRSHRNNGRCSSYENSFDQTADDLSAYSTKDRNSERNYKPSRNKPKEANVSPPKPKTSEPNFNHLKRYSGVSMDEFIVQQPTHYPQHSTLTSEISASMITATSKLDKTGNPPGKNPSYDSDEVTSREQSEISADNRYRTSLSDRSESAPKFKSPSLNPPSKRHQKEDDSYYKKVEKNKNVVPGKVIKTEERSFLTTDGSDGYTQVTSSVSKEPSYQVDDNFKKKDKNRYVVPGTVKAKRVDYSDIRSRDSKSVTRFESQRSGPSSWKKKNNYHYKNEEFDSPSVSKYTREYSDESEEDLYSTESPSSSIAPTKYSRSIPRGERKHLSSRELSYDLEANFHSNPYAKHLLSNSDQPYFLPPKTTSSLKGSSTSSSSGILSSTSNTSYSGRKLLSSHERSYNEEQNSIKRKITREKILIWTILVLFFIIFWLLVALFRAIIT